MITQLYSQQYFKLFIIALFSFTLQGSFAQSKLKKHEIYIASSTFLVEIADTEATRAMGLMYRTTLEENHGMLFVFPNAGYRSFYMKNTYIPLSIAYLDKNGFILEIYDMEPLNIRSIASHSPNVQYALELNQGAFHKAGITVGMQVLNLPAASQQ